jgi:cytochrome c peroxidase
MKKSLLFALAIGGTVLYLASCQKNATTGGDSAQAKTLHLPAQPMTYVSDVPETFRSIAKDHTPADNQITDHGATLGRVLFYDPKLSLNNLVACASCHKQDRAFSDPTAFSVGFENKKTTRNSMALANVRYQGQYFWDERESKLEDMVLQPVKNHIEMGMENIENLTQKLAKVEYYPALFEKAFGTREVTKERVGKALGQFLRSMQTSNSKYDQGVKTNFSNLTYEENYGRDLFFKKLNCGACHGGANFNERQDGKKGNFANIGLEGNYVDNGKGARPDGSTVLNGTFKIPTLRNIGLTAPYMHDGRFTTLEQTVEHYNSKVVLHDNLDDKMRGVVIINGYYQNDPTLFQTAQRLNLSTSDKAALVAFMKTLTDDSYTKDERFSNPFN